MRLARLIVSLSLEVGFVLAALGAVACITGGFTLSGEDPRVIDLMPFYWQMVAKVPWLAFIICCVTSVSSWCLAGAVGIPYRYKTAMPGIHKHQCWRCKISVRDVWWCSCGAFRPSKIVTSLTHALSLAITILFTVHDCVVIFAAASGAGRGRRGR